MRISVDDVQVFELNSTQMNVIKHDINEDAFDEDMKRRLTWVLNHKYEQCFERLKKEWEPKLASKGIQSIPTDRDAFAELVFSQAEYKSRKQRDLLTEVL